MNYTDADFRAVLDRMKAKADAENGPGAFEHSVRRGQLLMSKRADELTEAEREFLRSPPPAKQN